MFESVYPDMTDKPKIIITVDLPLEIVQKLDNSFEIIYHWKEKTDVPRDELKMHLTECNGIFCTLLGCWKYDKKLIENAKNLKVISTMSVGYDHICLDSFKERGIMVCNTPLPRLTETTADLVMAVTLATARRIPEASLDVINGDWPKSWQPFYMCGKDLYHSTVGIIGLGSIGKAVAKRLFGFSVNILYTGRSQYPEFAKTVNAKFVSLDELLQQSDFIIPLCSLTQETRNFFGMNEFKKMKRDAILINVSRGGVVNQDELIEALKLNIIGGCGLDVTTPEPLSSSSPLLSPELKSKVVITPHIGSASVETRMATAAMDNLISALSGEPVKYIVK